MPENNHYTWFVADITVGLTVTRMGCQQTKIQAKEKGDDLFLKSNGERNALQPALLDPNHPLNARQVFKLKKNWKGIKRNMEEAGVEMFIR